ncbi:hypothetical protein [Tenacibaculum soleae]|uniref:hypothetical protein n=1 Tax=Tenacibaculum soleae TaxID=447689 RepID=UPI0022FFF1B1|nr:hypothetical protein [Tenacibaculum soleae]
MSDNKYNEKLNKSSLFSLETKEILQRKLEKEASENEIILKKTYKDMSLSEVENIFSKFIL